MSRVPQHSPGPHELGQNFLVDHRILTRITSLVATTDGPIVELAAGDGSLTGHLVRLRRPLTAVEVDPRHVTTLRRRFGRRVDVVAADILRHWAPSRPHVVVGNVPFHITTPVMRRLLRTPHWNQAVLITQWEVARKRAGVGGATLLTAQWWPWFEADLVTRVPSSAFRPRPSVDAGVLHLTRRPAPWVSDRDRYQAFVKRVFSGPGRGVPDILRRAGVPKRAVNRWAAAVGVTARHLPRDLTAAQWVSAFEAQVGDPDRRPGPQ
ncbi:23S ribosomal RNA methyltransferase Erm [Microlunatus sp. Y2014]|uniref:23S ribosomal RNA methyltransferase Erm n=1 Tax=Microlunatus sp. Y2014 TaxID=3418488 RepID=UPI003DA72954